ncbi:MAG TPA: DUF6505 family protein [Usitatibacteraceae bacterium]|nr:DUF6505 family protein [Usitatibacteraceae bacterium]
MPKFLKAVRLDDSDAALYASACDDGEWVTSGGFAVCPLAEGYRCNPKCHCDASFLSLTRRARCTLAEVVEVTDQDLAIFRDQMAQHLLFDWKAPDFAAAREIADEEIDYTVDLASAFPTEVWLRVQRSAGADGAIEERYDQFDRLMIGSHPV